ncbi:Hsp33 family molecular chaperone HslO [Oligoflexus tunisiensis]|uniref:Hsp33 family molecular chaperone HslO n=1 Tax=Oligoflexus tunisiensis TaxID=708132 RepID=UPI00114CB439|nr:Hsp33 family molecular chaperone HslO [Oligoflexus tunisiensis]
MAELKKFLSKDGSIRIATVISTETVNDAFRYFEASPLAKTLMARAITGAILMASQMKERLGTALHFIGEGPIQSIFASAQYEGGAKVYCENRNAELPEGVTHLGAGLGAGRLDVIQSRPFEREPLRGTVELYTGEIGDDIAYYLNQSHQIPAIVSLAARPAEKGVEVAGGYIIELMPGYTDEIIQKLEQLQPLVESTVRKLQHGAAPEDLIDIYLDHFEFEEVTHPYKPHYECGCSVERVERSLLLLGRGTLDEMVKDKESAEIACEFCGCKYELSIEALKKLRDSLDEVPVH